MLSEKCSRKLVASCPGLVTVPRWVIFELLVYEMGFLPISILDTCLHHCRSVKHENGGCTSHMVLLDIFVTSHMLISTVLSRVNSVALEANYPNVLRIIGWG
jgi:hypothetical protein